MRIGFLITARLKSQRLPRKILKDLNGKTVIERIIDRVKEINGISEIVVCTSTNPGDRPLADIALKNDVYYFNGHEDDVLNRLLMAARYFGLDYFLGITADNPLITIKYSDMIVEEIKKNEYDFIKLEGLPFGSATYGMRVDALETVCRVKNVIDTEIWGRLIDQPEIFNVKNIVVKEPFNRPELRFTLDYEQDYAFINNLYTNIPFKNVLDLKEVFRYIDENPEVRNINRDCVQLDLDPSIIEKINGYYRDNRDEVLRLKREIYSNRKRDMASK